MVIRKNLSRFFSWVKRKCRTRRSLEFDYVPTCKNGDVKAVEQLLIDCPDLSLDEGLISAVENNHEVLTTFLIAKGAKKLDECLEIAVKKGNCSMAELLVQKGATPVAGIRVSKSNNITRMLYRHENGRENCYN